MKLIIPKKLIADPKKLEGDGNADAYWRRAKDDSCGTCIQRERDWSPVKIRSGVLQV